MIDDDYDFLSTNKFMMKAGIYGACKLAYAGLFILYNK